MSEGALSAALGSGVRVRLSADLPSSAQNNSAQETAERRKLGTRTRDIRDALTALGVPQDAIDLSPATAYSTPAHGKVSVDVSKRTALDPLRLPPALNRPAQEFEAATGTDKFGKAFDIAGAIGEMYDAADKAKCKQVPRASVELGCKRLLAPGSEADPTKLPRLDYAGITGTFHF